MWGGGEKKEVIEKELEKRVRESYSKGDYIRCYNLMKLLARFNHKNEVLHRYLDKVDEKKISKLRNRWALGVGKLQLFFSSPKFFVSLIMAMLFGTSK